MKNELLVTRTRVIKAIRAFFDEQGFVEMHTPRMVGLPGQEPYLEPLWTQVLEADGTQHRTALITSPEYAMKRLLADGWDKIYDLGPCFRNQEPWDGTHDVEFLMLEWYRRDAGLEELFQDTEEMIRSVDSCLRRNDTYSFVIPVPHDSAKQAPVGIHSTPFRRLTVAEAMKRYADVDLDALLGNREALASVVASHGHSATDADSWDDLFFKIFLSEVEPKLGWNDARTQWQPTFLYNYPASMAALARKNPQDPRYALRTELYIGDLELANGFAELCDAEEQRARFMEEQELRRSLGKDTWSLDERFLSALPGMGNAAGIAFGVDRLVMLLVGTGSISDVMPIPVRKRF